MRKVLLVELESAGAHLRDVWVDFIQNHLQALGSVVLLMNCRVKYELISLRDFDNCEILLSEPLTIFNGQPLCDAVRLTFTHFHLVKDVSQLLVDAPCCALQPFE